MNIRHCSGSNVSELLEMLRWLDATLARVHGAARARRVGWQRTSSGATVVDALAA